MIATIQPLFTCVFEVPFDNTSDSKQLRYRWLESSTVHGSDSESTRFSPTLGGLGFKVLESFKQG